MSTGSILYVSDLSHTFKLNGMNIEAIKNICFSVKSNEFIGLIGPSGCGKTTLINCLSGLLTPTSGIVKINGTTLTNLDQSKIRDFRLKNIGLVFQEHLLVESLTALENVELPMIFGKVPVNERKKIAEDLLYELSMDDKKNHLPDELSGGEQQRVGIARALIYRPKLLLADEPTGDLDTRTGQLILKIFKEITENGTTVIMVSHDPRHRVWFDRVLEMEDGKLVG